MENLRKGTDIAHEERVARIVWAAHILSYLTTNKRSLAGLHQAGADIEEFEDCGTGYETEKTVVVTGPRESVRKKFLDCIAQLLSPSKGWDGVTAAAVRERENFVEVDIARNDCFVSNKKHPYSETTDYCRKLEEYVCANAQDIDGPAASEFELKSIHYTYRRIDHWIADLRTILKSNQNCHDRDERRWHRLQLAVETWTNMTELILRLADIEVGKVRASIVQQAYMCVISTQVRQLLHNAFGPKVGSKLWDRLNLLARPMIDCRLLRSIASREPQFRNVRISLIPPKPKTSVNAKYRVVVSEAWAQLGFDSPSNSGIGMINSFGEDFGKACTQVIPSAC